MIPRPDAIERIITVFKVHPIAALLGPRQCGKTTLARMISEREQCTYFDLENPVDLRRLSAPMSTLEELSGLVVMDEIQRRPALFELLRVLVDRPKSPVRFLILGSASPGLIKGVSESLAGRIGFIDLSGFDLREVGTEKRYRLWIRGGFPRSFLAEDDTSSAAWREDFIRTFLERDIPQLGITIPAETLRRFWTMISHYHGQVWNAAHFARSLGTSEKTARRYLDILAGAYMVRVLPPWYENIRKRQVKAPKIYIRDSGILHALLQINTMADLQGHPKIGSSWEGFCLEQLIGRLKTRDVHFWATHAGAELDLLVTVAGNRYGFEFKYADAPGSNRSMRIAIEDLGLEHLWIIYPGREKYDIDKGISVVPIDLIQSLPVFKK
ncbi:MAG: ATP-binding protein [Candidatus Aminicenantes bacterium]|nr:ATP-binding protein [Candidatus Aminicenantes bacterium]HHF51464.1 ATP-binding protein [Candidatus Aminicenantes bacterium]